MERHASDATSGQGDQLSRRLVLAAAGGGLLAGCLNTGGEDTPVPDTELSSPTPTPTPTGTPESEWPELTGTEGGETDVDVTEHGATPDDDSDDTMGIRGAFQAAAKQGATVTFPSGTYNIQSRIPQRRQFGVPFDAPIFSLAEYEGLTIEGPDATLSASGRMAEGEQTFAGTFTFTELRDLTIRGLTIQWNRSLPHTGGVVRATTEDHFDLEVADPYTAREGLYPVSLIGYDLENERIDHPLYLQRDLGEQCTPQSDSVLRVPKTDAHADIFEEGQGVLVRHAGSAGFAIRGSAYGLTVEDVTVHSNPGFACGIGGSDFTWENVQVVPRGNLWNSATRDCFHFGGVSGEVVMRDCKGIKAGDDVLNIKTIRRDGVTVVDETTLQLPGQVGPHWFNEGDELEIGAPPNRFVPDTTATIASIDGPRTGYRLTLEEPLPQTVRNADEVNVNNSGNAPDSVLLENFEGAKIRGRGFRLGVDNVEIVDCDLHDIVYEAVLPWHNPIEGEPPENFTVRDTRFHDVQYGADERFETVDMRWRTAAIATRLHQVTGAKPADHFRTHTYENNTFEAFTQGVPAFNLNWISDVTIEGNDFSGVAAPHPVYVGPGANCESISVDGQSGCQFTSEYW
jgi:hypothetical protein